MLNLNNIGNRNHKRALSIQDAHSKIIERDAEGKVKRVKFEKLKYNLDELFKNQPAFAEPVPLYGQMNDFVPQKLKFPIQKKREFQDLDEESKRELDEANNFALLNLNRNEKDYKFSMWKHFKEIVFNPQIKREVIKGFDRV